MKNIQKNYHAIMDKLNAVGLLLDNRFPGPKYLTNQEFIKLFGITDWDAQTIRALNLIPFEFQSRIIVYRFDDVMEFCKREYEKTKTNPHA